MSWRLARARGRSFLNYLRRPSRDTLLILDRINLMATSIADLTAAFKAYQQNVERLIQENKDANQAAIDKALADDEIKDSDALQVLADEIKAANDKLVPPPFDPSANG